jgi:hypothetical protein
VWLTGACSADAPRALASTPITSASLLRRQAPGLDAGAKAPLLVAYEQAYLPKVRSASAGDDEVGTEAPRAAHAPAAPRFAAAAPGWRDVLLTAAFVWLAGLGLLLIIAMARLAAHQVRRCMLARLTRGQWPDPGGTDGRHRWLGFSAHTGLCLWQERRKQLAWLRCSSHLI